MAAANLAVLAALLLILTPLCEASSNLFSDGWPLRDSYLEEGPYRFYMQDDCNLVLYNDDAAVWATNTAGLGRSCFCSLQSDGNLVIHTGDGQLVWASNTRREEGAYVLILREKGDVVIYGDEIWPIASGNGSTSVVSLKINYI